MSYQLRLEVQTVNMHGLIVSMTISLLQKSCDGFLWFRWTSLRTELCPFQVLLHFRFWKPPFVDCELHQLAFLHQYGELIHKLVLEYPKAPNITMWFGNQESYILHYKQWYHTAHSRVSSSKFILHNKSARRLRFPFAHSVFTISGAFRSMRRFFTFTQRINLDFAAFRSLTWGNHEPCDVQVVPNKLRMMLFDTISIEVR